MRMLRHPVLLAALLAGLTVALVLAIFVVDPVLADVLTREDGVIEWLQAGLFAVAAALGLRAAAATWRAGRPPVLEVLLASLLVGLIIGEVDLDRIVFGRKIIHTRFLVDAEVGIGWRVLAAAGMALPPAALALYALRHWRELWAAGRRALAEPSGRVLLAGLAIFALTELFERPLGRVPGLPRYMLEEVLELVAGLWLGAGLLARERESNGTFLP
jgi:hypothetical protein